MINIRIKTGEEVYISAKNVESISLASDNERLALIKMVSGTLYQVPVKDNTDYYLLIQKITEEDNSVRAAERASEEL